MSEKEPTSPNTGGETPESDEFDQFFAEYSGADAEPSEQDDTSEPAESKDAESQDAGGSEQSQETSEPAQEAGPDTTQNNQPQGQETTAEDIWANATEEQRAAYKAAQDQLRQLDHADRSNRGRIAALQRQIKQLSNQMTDDHAEKRQSSGSGKQKGGQSNKTPDTFETEDWQKLKEEYPEVLGPVEQALRSRDEQLQQLNERVQTFDQKFQGLDQAHQDAYMAGQEQVLAEQHPDWEQITASRDFMQWYERAPEPVRAAIEQNAEGIVNAQNAAFALDLFKRETGQPAGQSSQNNQQPSGQSGGQDRTRSRRQRQLQAAPSVSGKGPGAASNTPDDFENAFEHYARK